MRKLQVDVAVLGAGFGGSLMCLVLERLGRSAVLIDRGAHPRFAIGESSTPVADFVLRDLAHRYQLDWLEPLSRYGSWVATYPDVQCGLKRGFTYFRQPAESTFAASDHHENELVVAASRDDEHSDTHWLRADVDAFYAAQVVRAEMPYLDQTTVEIHRQANGWRLAGMRHGEPIEIAAHFLIDATGEAGLLAKVLNIPSRVDQLHTRSRAVFSHFRQVRPWRELLAEYGGRVEDHPFHCDHAALHQVLDEGWMWQLRFRNGVTSAGFALDLDSCPISAEQTPEDEWQQLMRRYPSLAAQFEGSEIVTPPGRLLRSGRLQRLSAQVAGENWAMLPHTAGFIDPLHSSGIAQTLCGVERLGFVFSEHWGRGSFPEALRRYQQTFYDEITLIDQLVSGCYRARVDFRLFAAFSMLYFASAHTYENRRLAQQVQPGAAFLCADDPQLRRCVAEQWARLRQLSSDGRPSMQEVHAFEEAVARAIEPYNTAGLCDRRVHNMYRYTAVR